MSLVLKLHLQPSGLDGKNCATTSTAEESSEKMPMIEYCFCVTFTTEKQRMTVRDTLQHHRSTLSQPLSPTARVAPHMVAPRLARFPGPKHAQTHRGPSLQPPRARLASLSVILPRPGEARETSMEQERVSNDHMPALAERGSRSQKSLCLKCELWTRARSSS